MKYGDNFISKISDHTRLQNSNHCKLGGKEMHIQLEKVKPVYCDTCMVIMSNATVFSFSLLFF